MPKKTLQGVSYYVLSLLWEISIISLIYPMNDKVRTGKRTQVEIKQEHYCEQLGCSFCIEYTGEKR